MNQPATADAPILIFPAGMPRSLDYLARALREGRRVIGSSSLSYDVSQPQYPEWAHLPYVNDADFGPRLAELASARGIQGIYTPNPFVWNFLNENLATMAPGVRLVNDWPMNEELAGYADAEVRARALLADGLPVASAVPAQPAMAERKLAALFRQANVIPGMCDNEKIGALAEVARHGVAGDVVEIGAAFGKSAFVLAQLARHYRLGKLLCVDPWQAEFIVQKDKGGLVDSCIDKFDHEQIVRVFEMNLLPACQDDVNYLRLPSHLAVEHYRGGQPVTTPAFGTTQYAGRIALLHVDGNHSYDAASADIRMWSPFLAPGGWLIVDDYVWPYGDGPQRAGDEFLASERDRIHSSFVIGSALFIQIAQ